MSQIPRAQYAVKKQQQTRSPFEVDHQNGKTPRAAKTLAAEKITDSLENDVLILDDNLFDVVSHEDVIAETISADDASDKRKRSRKSKDSTESKDSDRSKKTNGSSASDTKIVKASFEDFTQKQRKRAADRLQNASTIVNLSTVSTSESAIIREDTLSTATPTAERRTSGRRVTRPIDEIKFEYRTPDLDESLNVSTNATLGSVDNESLLTTPGTDRKRPMNDDETMESPKRSRLDLSGLFNSFSSPVALLRNRFKRANIASTPLAGGDRAPLNDSLESLEEIAEPIEKEEEKPAEVEQEEDVQVTTTPIKKNRACIVM